VVAVADKPQRRLRALAGLPVARLRRDSLARNSILIMATTLVTSALGAVYWVLAARLYPAAAVGLAAALLSAMALAASLSTLGIQATLVHRLPRQPSGPAWSATVVAAIGAAGIAALAGAGILVLALPRLGSEFALVAADGRYEAVLALGVAATTIAVIIDYAFIAERSSGRMLVRNGVFSCVKVPLLLVAGASALGILISWVAAAFVGLAVSALLLAALGRGSRRPPRRAVTGELRALVPVLPAQHAITVTASLPMFVLPLLVAAELSATDNARFYTTWMVGSIFFIVSPAVAWSLFAEGRRADADLPRLVRRAAVLNLLLLGPLVVAFLLAGRFALVVFGPGYSGHEAELLLAVLVLSAIPDAVTNTFVAVMRARGTLAPAVVLNAGMAGGAIALAALLLPALGIVGAGLAWILAQLAGALGVLVYGWRRRR
jgi:O-antigen/teichoic acid export membrane protein